jgi:hypothetical protein
MMTSIRRHDDDDDDDDDDDIESAYVTSPASPA